MEEGRSAFKILTGTSAGKRPLGRPRHRWKDNIRMDLKDSKNVSISRTLKGKTQLTTQIKFYKVMAVPVLMYGSENWSLSRSGKRKTEAAEISFLRPMAVWT